jgi:hypothetical protein
MTRTDTHRTDVPSADQCWKWPLYGRVEDGRAQVGKYREYVYRLLYVAAGGELGQYQLAHHTCEHPWCINPFHIEPQDDHSAHATEHGRGGDWGQGAKTHCPEGHPYDDENTQHITRGDGTHERHCRTCARRNKAKYRRQTRNCVYAESSKSRVTKLADRWFVETVDALGRRAVSLDEAVAEAREIKRQGGTVKNGLPGGSWFDRKMGVAV